MTTFNLPFLTEQFARDALRAILDEHPDLGRFGFRQRGTNPAVHDAHRKIDDEFLMEFCFAATWLVRQRQVKRPQAGSYGLKHFAERSLGSYVSNGALIAAAIHLGFPIERRGSGPNASLGVARRLDLISDEHEKRLLEWVTSGMLGQESRYWCYSDQEAV